MGGFLACILAGAAMSIQGVMNTRLSEHIGTMETNAFVQCVAAVLSLLVLVFWRTGSFAALGAAPKYCWFGGVLAARRSPWRRSSSRSWPRPRPSTPLASWARKSSPSAGASGRGSR